MFENIMETNPNYYDPQYLYLDGVEYYIDEITGEIED